MYQIKLINKYLQMCCNLIQVSSCNLLLDIFAILFYKRCASFNEENNKNEILG